MKVLDLLAEIEEIVDTSSGVPLTGKIMVDANELLQIVSDIKDALPDDIQQAQWIKNERDRILGEAKSEYETIIRNAEQQAEDMIETSDILTNSTSVGMAPHEDGCLIRERDVLRPSLIVSDVIYHPEETRLLQMARENGCPAFNGLYMLLYQGAAAFKLWTGQDMPVPMIKERYFRR